MAYWVDEQGQIQEADEDTAQRYGLRPASDEDLLAHNERLADEAADTKGALGNIAEGVQRGMAHVQDIARDVGWTPPVPGGDAFGMGGSIPAPPGSEAAAGTPLPPAGAESFPEATGDDARRRSRLHPMQQGLGTGLVALPISGLAGAAAGALGGPVVAGAALAGVGAESLVEAIAQEYDDAWLEKRPMQLSNVVAYTAMFSVGDVLLRGAGHVAKEAIGDIGSALGIFGKQYEGGGAASAGRNIVAEAQARAERGGVRQTQSVGAASAKEMNEPFDDALATMSDRDATVLARDAEDFEPLIAMHSADDITRLNTGLSESLGNQLKKRDVQIASDALKPAQIQAQQGFARDVIDTALQAADHLRTGGPARIKFGNHGRAIVETIESYARQLQDTAAPADRFNLLNELKQGLDREIMSAAGDWRYDKTAQSQVLKILAPLMGENLGKGVVTKGALREGLENVAYFGEAAKLQKSLNAPWHDLLTHWRAFQKALLEETGATEWGVTGAGRVGRESTDERVMAMITKNPRMLRQMGEHVGGVYDAYQRLIEARQAHGYVEKEGLDALADTVRNLMEDWNLASTIGVAKQKAKNKLRDPRKWAGKALDLAENLPGVGGPLKAARGVGTMFGDLHIQKGTPLAGVWDNALKRYARHPALEDASIYANYSPWMQDALRARGARIPGGPSGGAAPAARAAAGAAAPPEPPPSGGAAGSPGFGWGKAAEKHGGKVAGAGLLGASAAEGDDHPEGAAGAAVGGLALLLGKGRKLLPQEARALLGTLGERAMGGSRLISDGWSHLHVDLAKALDSAEPLTLKRIEKHATEWVRDPSNPLKSFEVERPIEILREAVGDALAALPEGATKEAKAAETDRVLRTIVSSAIERRAAPAKAVGLRRTGDVAAPTMPRYRRAAAAVDEWADPDVRKALLDITHDDKFDWINEKVRLGSSKNPERIQAIQAGLLDAAEAGLNLPGTTHRVLFLRNDEVARLLKAKEVVAESFMATSANRADVDKFASKTHKAHPGKTRFMLEVQQESGIPFETGEREVILPAGTRFDVVHAEPGRVVLREQPGTATPVADVATKPPAWGKAQTWVAGGLLGLASAAAAGNASAAEPNPRVRPQDAPPPPDPGDGPVGMYRDAVRTIAEGGDAIIRDKASSMLRARAPKGRGALRAFTGRRSLDDAVDQAREALDALGRDPAALVERLAGSVGDLGRTHPSVYMALVGKASSLVSYLAAEAPPRTGQTLLDPEGSPPSLDRSLDFAYKAVGTLMPVRAMDDVARLDAPPEEVAAFQQNWPELWEPLRAELLGQLQRRTEAGRPVDAEKLRQLDAILGMNGQLDPSGSVEVGQHMLAAQEQAAAAPPAQGGQAPSGSPNGTSSAFRTRLDTVAVESQTA